MARGGRWMDWIGAELARGFLWSPVCLSLGILGYFQLGLEPTTDLLIASAIVAAVGMAVAVRASYGLRPLVWAVSLLACGFALAGWRGVALAAPVLEWRYYGPVEGRVIGLDRSASGALRVMLDEVRLGRMELPATPKRVRLSIYGPDEARRPVPGSRIMTTAHLSPPSGPAEPYGFDFQRHAWFLELGGVGYTRVPVLLAAPPRGGFSFFALRIALSDRIQTHLGGQSGAFAAALMTGDRSGLTQDTLSNLRHSNLAHLLAISGLHMGLLAGFVFAALRISFLALPKLADGGRAKKGAALGALCVAAGYLGLSGASVATERAFIMAAVALGAVALDRRAISLRAVALAALIVLIRRPEALTGPGFQMSFAATTALVVVFTTLSRRTVGGPHPSKLRRALAGTVISSTVAGLATLPIAAAHFNLVAHYGLIANLASVPLMGVMIIPLAVIAVCLMPLGWEGPVLKVMGQGLEWILWVAAQTSGMQGAVSKVPAPPPWALFAFLLGAVVVGIGATRLRWLGIAPMATALIGWALVERPDILISDTGGLVGALTPGGRALSKERGSGFVASIWLENDGDKADQLTAAQLWSTTPLRVGHGSLFAAPGKRGMQGFQGCETGDIAVFSERFSGSAPCEVFDQARLRSSGSVAISYDEAGQAQITTAREVAGRRYWNDRQIRRRLLQDQ